MILFSIIGTLIGAGFASGQEIYLFFYKYGLNGIIGLVLCSVLIGIITYKAFLIIYNNKTNTYEEFLGKIFKSKKIIKISNITINAFLLITFYIMLSGFGAYFEQRFQINSLIGTFILAIICFCVLLKDIEGVKKVNSICVPILVILVLTIGFFSLKEYNPKNIEMSYNFSWIIQAIIYSSYNMILVIPVLVSLGKYIKSKKQISLISIGTALIIFNLAISIFFILANLNVDYSKIQMPVVYTIDNNFTQFSGIYGFVILLSIFSTAISIGISFLKNVAKDKKSFPQIVAMMCISGIMISNFGFSNLVKILFPLFGYLGIVEFVCLFKTKTSNKEVTKKT